MNNCIEQATLAVSSGMQINPDGYLPAWRMWDLSASLESIVRADVT